MDKLTDKIIVLNNHTGLLQVGIRVAGEAEPLLLQLNIGANAVDAKLWEHAKKAKQVQLWMSTKSKAPDVQHGAMMVAESTGLPALDEESADKLLRETFDKGLLARWAAEEERVAIKTLVQNRIAEMERIEKNAVQESKQRAAAAK